MSEFAVVTTLNEAGTIGALVLALRNLGMRVIVVDDGSGDGTADLAGTAGAQVLENVGRMGIGPSLMRGWELCLAQGAQWVVQLDAGGSHEPEEALRLLGRLRTLDVDVVIGSRFRARSRYVGGPWWRPLGSRAMAAACRWAQPGAWYSDWTSGFRAFNRRALEVLLTRRYQARMHGWQMEVLAYAGEAGLRVAEAPISYVAGRSSFDGKVAHEAVGVWLGILNHVGPVGRDARFCGSTDATGEPERRGTG